MKNNSQSKSHSIKPLYVWIVRLILIATFARIVLPHTVHAYSIVQSYLSASGSSHNEEFSSTSTSVLPGNVNRHFDLTDAGSKAALYAATKDKNFKWYVEAEETVSTEAPAKVVQATKTKPEVKPVTQKAKTITLTSKKYSQAQLDVAHKIVEIAKAEKFDRLSFLLALLDCESSFNPKNKNTKGNTPSWSVDRGIAMINNHWKGHVTDKCAYDLECAVKFTISELRAGRQNHWVCTNIVLKENRVPQYQSFLQ